MRFVKQPITLPIINLDRDITKQDRRHGPLLPNTIRCIICGPSNCGKTNLIMSLLEDVNGLRFQNVYVYAKSLFQSKYMLLEEMLKTIDGMEYHGFSNNDEVPQPHQIKGDSIIIFDDVGCEKQDNIRAYFAMGRHNCVDSFYLSQTYNRIPKHLIRDNCNLIIIFKQDEMNLKKIFSDHVNPDISFKQFLDICRECWKDKYGFMVIDKDSDTSNGRFRRGFDEYTII